MTHEEIQCSDEVIDVKHPPWLTMLAALHCGWTNNNPQPHDMCTLLMPLELHKYSGFPFEFSQGASDRKLWN